MKSLSKFLKFGDLQIIFILILILIPINFLLFASRGEGAEFFGSTQYIQFVRLFPESLGDVRLEPLYIVITRLIWEITSFSLPSIFAFTRYFVWAAEIIFVYLIFEKITNQKILAILGTLIFNFSFAQFAIANNLFRNHTANLLVFILIFVVINFFTTKVTNLKKYIIVAGVLLGLVTYTHIFMSAVISATSVAFLFVTLILKIFSKNTYIQNFPKNTLQFLIGALLTDLIISIPFLVRTLPFYWILVTSFLTGRGPWEIRPPPQFTLNLNFFSDIFSNFLITPANSAFSIFRFLFEFKQISIPLVAIFLVFVSVTFIIFKARNSINLFILSFWLVTYLGTKLEFLGIGVVPTRFTTIAFFPSIFLLAFLAAPIFKKISNLKAKIGLAIIILTLFISQNLPSILETTVLVNSGQIKKRDELTAQVLKETAINIKPTTAVFSLNTGLPNLRNDLILGYPAEFFSTNDPQKAFEIAKTFNLKYFLFDQNIKAVRSGVTGEWIYLDFQKFKESKYFQLLSEKENSFASIALYQISNTESLTGPKTPQKSNEFFIKSPDEFQKIDKTLSAKEITNWIILVNLSEGAKIISEKVFLNDEKIVIHYSAENFVKVQQEKFGKRLTISLPELKSRSNIASAKIGIFIPNAITHLPKAGQHFTFSYLSEFSYDNYFVETEVAPKQLLGFSLNYLDRDQFRLSVRLMVTFFGSLIFVVFFLLTVFAEKKLVFWKLDKKDFALSYILSAFVILAIFDSAFFTTFFTSFYRNLFQ